MTVIGARLQRVAKRSQEARLSVKQEPRREPFARTVCGMPTTKNIERSIRINGPREQVWRFMMDFKKAPEWMPEILELRQTSEGPLGLGATLERKVKRGIFPLRIIEYEPNRTVAYEFTSKFVKGTKDSYKLETVDGETSVIDSVDIKLSGFYRLLGPVLKNRLKKVVTDRVRNLKRILESETPAA